MQDVERVFGKGTVVADPVEEIGKRSYQSEKKENISKATKYPKAVMYNPLVGEPWDIIVYVFYDDKEQMKDYCFGGQ